VANKAWRADNSRCFIVLLNVSLYFLSERNVFGQNGTTCMILTWTLPLNPLESFVTPFVKLRLTLYYPSHRRMERQVDTVCSENVHDALSLRFKCYEYFAE